MNKLPLIIKREYLTRVMKRSFWLTTLLVPLGIMLLYGVVALMVLYQSDESVNIAVLDRGEILENFENDSLGNINLIRASQDLVTLKDNMEALNYDGVLEIPALGSAYDKKLTVFYYADDKPSLEVQERVRSWIRDHVRTYKQGQLELDSVKLAALKTKIAIDPKPIDETEEDTSSTMSSAIAAMIASVLTMIMLLVITIYGNMVMQGVMEEKTNRIVEVIISSVRPFQLMLGKIVGIGLVGLTQIGIWALLIPIVSLVAGLALGISGGDPVASANLPQDLDPAIAEEGMAMVQQVLVELSNMNWALMIPSFMLFFLGGYFMYASLFAAVGSAIGDDIAESQALTVPITIPIILASYMTFFVVIRAPDSSLSVAASMFPLFSPLVMPARMAFDPPIWQVLLSLVLLIATCLALVWLAGRIYRVGILLYGKKYNFLQMMKWVFYKD